MASIPLTVPVREVRDVVFRSTALVLEEAASDTARLCRWLARHGLTESASPREVLLAVASALRDTQPSVTVEDILPDVQAWLTANGIDPNDVPEHAVPVVADGQVICHVFQRNERGHHYVDKTTYEMAVGSVTVPLVVDPPEALRDWIAGRVPTRAPSIG